MGVWGGARTDGRAAQGGTRGGRQAERHHPRPQQPGTRHHGEMDGTEHITTISEPPPPRRPTHEDCLSGVGGAQVADLNAIVKKQRAQLNEAVAQRDSEKAALADALQVAKNLQAELAMVQEEVSPP